MPTGTLLYQRKAIYYWRRRLPAALRGWLDKRYFFLSLETPAPTFARRLVTLLDAKLEKVVTAIEHHELHISPAQLNAVLREVVSKHCENPDEPVPSGDWPATPDWITATSAAIFVDTCSRMSQLVGRKFVDVIAAYSGNMMFRPWPQCRMILVHYHKRSALRLTTHVGSSLCFRGCCCS